MDVKVVVLRRARNFEELFDILPLTKCGYDKDDVSGAYLHMKSFPGYSIENQKVLGVVGIEFEEIPFAQPKYRYLKKQSWEGIAIDLNVSYRTAHRIHASALRNFIIPE